MVVLHGDCDLEQDFNYRSSPGAGGIDEANAKIVPEVLLCDLYVEAEIRQQVAGGDIWKRVRQNQDERYHQLLQAPISDGGQELPPLFLDFKRSFMDRTPSLYDAISSGAITRVAIIPDVFVHDLMQRYFAYHARVALPD